MSQVSWSFPSYDDEYDEPGDRDGEWIDMSGIPEDVTFEETELACMLENLQKGKKRSSKGVRRGKKGWSKGESRDVLQVSTKEAGKGGRAENNKQLRLKLESDRLNRGWRDQSARGTNKGRGRPQLVQVDDLLARTLSFKCGGRALRRRSWLQVPKLSSVAWFVTKPVLVSLETFRVLVTLETIPVLVTFETNPVLKLILEKAVC